MVFSPEWVSLLPANIRPNKTTLSRLESVRNQYNIPHEVMAMRVLESKAVMRRVQRNCLEDLRRAYPNATNKELLKGVLVSRLKTTAQLNISIYNLSEQEINGVMAGINTLDDLVKYIAELEAQEPHPPDPLPSVGNLINAILDEDFCSPLESSQFKETTPYIKKQTEKPVETKSCPYCGNSIAVDVLKCPSCGKYAQKCVNHPRRQGRNICVVCGQFLCWECRGEAEGVTYCPECFDNLPEEFPNGEGLNTETSLSQQERNWFKRHLNWTALLSSIITTPLLALVAQGWKDSFINGSVVAIEIVLTLVAVCIFIPLWVWLLRSKERSLWWLLLVPINYIMAYYLSDLWSIMIIIPNILLVCYYFMSNKTLDVYQQPADNTEPES